MRGGSKGVCSLTCWVDVFIRKPGISTALLPFCKGHVANALKVYGYLHLEVQKESTVRSLV